MVEFIHDEGAVAECLDAVFAAMCQTMLPPTQRVQLAFPLRTS